jgi:outer membrane protein assembly factor BamD (BamD/ComL family)
MKAKRCIEREKIVRHSLVTAGVFLLAATASAQSVPPRPPVRGLVTPPPQVILHVPVVPPQPPSVVPQAGVLMGFPAGAVVGIPAGTPAGFPVGIPAILPAVIRDDELDQKERKAEQKEREAERQEREKERALRNIEREHDLYESAQDLFQEGRYERAAQRFAQVAELKGKKADAALYWQAYSLHKLARKEEALAVLASLQRSYAQSPYVKDAKALEVEVRQSTAVPSQAVSEEDCELKLLALNNLMHADPEKAVPILEKFLTASQPCKLDDRALFILAQSSSPRARDLMAQIARGERNKDLQRKAIRNLGLFGGRENRQILSGIYTSSSDVDIKRQVLRSFMQMGDKDRLVTAAKTEKDPDLRKEAVRQLGVIGARAEVWQLYQTEQDADVRAQVLNALFISGDVTRMIELARAEQDPDLRRKAVRNLGLMGQRTETSAVLMELYANDKDGAIRREVVNALFLQNNVKTLVDLARKETDPEMKKVIVSKLSLMRSKEALDYLMEILNK